MFVLDHIAAAGATFVHELLAPGSAYSIFSLLSAAIIIVISLVFKNGPKGRSIPLGSMVRRILPRHIILHQSTLMDLKCFAVTLFVLNGIMQYAFLSYPLVKDLVQSALTAGFGAVGPSTLSVVTLNTLLTLGLFLATEFAYWIDHVLSHRIPLLWEFHKTHHTAEVLTPLTNWRVHPVDSFVFGNITVLCCATTHAVVDFLSGREVGFYAISSHNLIIVGFVLTLQHLQHTHLWLSFRGVLGRLVSSPAHHQVHHSKLPQHLGKNFGGNLALWDWVFGTLYIPAKTREKLEFGVDGPYPHAHQIGKGFMLPFADAAATLTRQEAGRPVPGPALQSEAARAMLGAPG